MTAFATNEAGTGAISNELDAIFHGVAEKLGALRAEGFNEETRAYRELLAIYVALAMRDLDRFYGKTR